MSEKEKVVLPAPRRIRWKNVLPPWYRSHPFPPDKKEPCFIDHTKLLDWSTGKWDKKNYQGIYIYVCTDTMICSTFDHAPDLKVTRDFLKGSDAHPGDQIFYIVDNSLCQYDAATGELGEAYAGDVMYSPKGVWHTFVNMTNKPTKAFALNCPTMCYEDEGPTEGYLGEPKTFDPSEKVTTSMRRFPQVSDRIVTGRIIKEREAILTLLGKEILIPARVYINSDYMFAAKCYLQPRQESEKLTFNGDQLLITLTGSVDVECTNGSVEKKWSVGKYDAVFTPAHNAIRYANKSDENATFLIINSPPPP